MITRDTIITTVTMGEVIDLMECNTSVKWDALSEEQREYVQEIVTESLDGFMNNNLYDYENAILSGVNETLLDGEVSVN